MLSSNFISNPPLFLGFDCDSYMLLVKSYFLVLMAIDSFAGRN